MKPHPIRRAIESLGPYTSLCALVVPLMIVEPLKLVALFIAGSGHWMTGAVTIGCAYALSLFLVERLFQIVKPKLLTLRWFAALWKRFIAMRGAVLGRLGLQHLREEMSKQPPPAFRSKVVHQASHR